MKGSTRTALGLLLLVGIRLLRDLWALASAPLRYANIEESYNATESWMLLHSGLWRALPALQYKDFCGGCTVVAGLGAPLLWLAGDHLLAWKGLALAWTAATLLLAWLAVDRGLGRRAAWAALLALTLAPAGLQDLSLMLWGNHHELALPLFAALALLGTSHRFSLGLVLGLSWWFCRTSLYFEVVLLPLALWAPGRRRLLAGLALGLAPLLIPTGGLDAGPYRLGLADQLLPQGLPGALDRLGSLFDPRELGPRLAMARGANAAPALVAAGLGACILLWRRRWRWVLLPAAFALAFCLTGFHVPLVGKVVPVVNARYHAPWLLWLTLLPALGAAEARRWWAWPLLLGPVIAGWRVPPAPTTLIARLPAAWPAAFAINASRRIALVPDDNPSGTVACLRGVIEADRGASSADSPDARACMGFQWGAGPWNEARIAKTNTWLADQPLDEALDYGRGMGVAMGRWLATGPGSTEKAIARLRAPDGRCPLCAAAGAVALHHCAPGPGAPFDPDATGACIAVQGQGDPEIGWGAGASWWRPWLDPELVAQVAEAAGPAFALGARSPLAGVEDAR